MNEPNVQEKYVKSVEIVWNLDVKMVWILFVVFYFGEPLFQMLRYNKFTFLSG